MRLRKRLAVGAAVAVVAGVALAAPAFAQDAAPPRTADEVSADLTSFMQSVNLLWILIGAILVIFMQAGFALVETGFCRAKHAAHVVSTNFAIFGLGFIGFFFVGYPLAFGGFDMQGYFGEGQGVAVGHSLLGSDNWVFLWQGGWAMSGSTVTAGILAFFLYMVA